MEPVTVITSAIMFGIANLSKEAIKDGYQKLKFHLQQKFGESSDLSDVINKLESKPDSAGLQLQLKEEVESSKAYEDKASLELAQALIGKEERPSGITSTISNITAGRDVISNINQTNY